MAPTTYLNQCNAKYSTILPFTIFNYIAGFVDDVGKEWKKSDTKWGARKFGGQGEYKRVGVTSKIWTNGTGANVAIKTD